ncbi:amidohydrolase family protein, partial [Candidatus Bathyarchaeota archaeon]|nr:amidohydrolase family protein [Candidatus Bathyarchaeota archaeon]
MQADLVLVNGKVVTMDPAESIAEAVAVKYNRIEKVGTTAEVLELKGDDTEVIDLGGRTVVPGFIDSHCHMIS